MIIQNCLSNQIYERNEWFYKTEWRFCFSSILGHWHYPKNLDLWNEWDVQVFLKNPAFKYFEPHFRGANGKVLYDTYLKTKESENTILQVFQRESGVPGKPSHPELKTLICTLDEYAEEARRQRKLTSKTAEVKSEVCIIS